MSKWFKRKGAQSLPVKLLCFPYAGGTAQIYDGWYEFFELLGIEVIAVQYPGRMERIGEVCVGSAPEIVSIVNRELKEEGLFDFPFFVYGHSNGAIAAFEFARQYESLLGKPLEHLILAARNVPNDNHRSRSSMSDDELKQELKELNGTPDELLNNREFMELILPSFRADFSIGENYRIPCDLQLCSPAHFIYGTEESICEKDVEAWQQHFLNRMDTLVLPAEHLFVNTHRQELLSMLKCIVLDKFSLQSKCKFNVEQVESVD